MFWEDTYSEVAARFKNWLETSTSGNAYISDLALDYINRALSSLLLEAPGGWDYLTVDRYTLTLSGTTGLECALPTDCGIVLKVYTDPTGTHKPTIYYTKDGKVPTGFRWMGSFVQATGFAATKIKFFYAPIAVPFLKYQMLVPKFTGMGTEYCAFPAELLLMEAQHLRCREKGLMNEWKMVSPEYESYLKKFKAAHQNVAEDPQLDILDAQGVPVMIPQFGLQTGTTQRQPWGKRNDMDFISR